MKQIYRKIVDMGWCLQIKIKNEAEYALIYQSKIFA